MSERFIQRDLILQPVSFGVFLLSALQVHKLLHPPQTLSHPGWRAINYNNLPCIRLWSCPSSVRGINPVKLGHTDLHFPSFESLSLRQPKNEAQRAAGISKENLMAF